jgi:HlyD family secretion protein
MTVSIDIEVARRLRTLVVPVDAIHNVTGAEPWVMRITHGHASRQPVKLGLRGGGKVEILSGIQAGDKILATTTAQVVDGARVRILRATEK